MACAEEHIPIKLTGPEQNEICFGCHSLTALKKRLPTGKMVTLFVDAKQFDASVHSTRTCTECHTDITYLPHSKVIEKVNCGRCHYINPVVSTAPQKQAAQYQESVHKAALLRGNEKAPSCQECHGAHDIKAAVDPKSRVYRPTIPHTCGSCHLDIYRQYAESIHGADLEKGNLDVPVCTDCHGEHSIRSPKDPLSSVYATKVPETCSRCHASERIERRNNLAVAREETYRESFHGIASRYGDTAAANCASCHGSHDIRPSSDPKSSINKLNLPHTCGKCHPGANENFGKGKIHVIIQRKEQAFLYYVSNGFKWLTISVMAALIGHIGLDLLGRRRKRRQEKLA